MARTPDITGQRFGLLTAVSVDQSSDRGVVWLCDCDCGGQALRVASYLASARRRGVESACDTCNAEARRGFWVETREKNRSWFAYRYAVAGELYSQRWEASETEALRQELGLDEPEERISSAAEATCYVAAGGEEYAPLPVELKAKGGWSCGCCGRIFTHGLGCLQCLKPICPKCWKSIGHDCTGTSARTQQEIGARLGVSRNRAMQIEHQALSRLRHRHAAELRPFVEP